MRGCGNKEKSESEIRRGKKERCTLKDGVWRVGESETEIERMRIENARLDKHKNQITLSAR